MFLGIEIGGTKLQLGIGAGDRAKLLELERRDVDANAGAEGILEQIAAAGTALLRNYSVESIGVGFGGPVDSARGITIKSNQIAGWDAFPLASWCQERFGAATVVGNDCDAAALAEACYGAGRGRSCVFYVTVGTGIGGGLVVERRLHGSGRPAVAEIGHLRPGLAATTAGETVESIASGPAIGRWVRSQMARHGESSDIGDLLQRCGGDLMAIDARIVAAAAQQGNQIALSAVQRATQTLGWGVAQVVTLVAPELVVIGGGVSSIGESLFFAPLRSAVKRYVFPPLADSYEILPAGLGESVVVHGAIALAAG